MAAVTQALQSTAAGYVFKSSLLCPYANLAIEDYIFRHSRPGSRVLLFYRNNKSIIIGRNQNPWVEVNLQRLRELAPQKNASVHLLRRRSGGGAVYHDRGNVNWSFMCDSSEFTRDKYAKLIVKSLRSAGIQNANVNERHDIVLDENFKSLKVSGSAYKISRQRALHHGTALLNSDLEDVSTLLRSPSRPFVTTRGTESVRSPVTNIGISNRVFENFVEQSFRSLYDLNADSHPTTKLGQECLKVEEIRKGYDELRSNDWTFCQTPRFEFSYNSLRLGNVKIQAKSGVLSSFSWETPEASIAKERPGFPDQKIHDIVDWNDFLDKIQTLAPHQDGLKSEVGSVLNKLLPGAH